MKYKNKSKIRRYINYLYERYYSTLSYIIIFYTHLKIVKKSKIHKLFCSWNYKIIKNRKENFPCLRFKI